MELRVSRKGCAREDPGHVESLGLLVGCDVHGVRGERRFGVMELTKGFETSKQLDQRDQEMCSDFFTRRGFNPAGGAPAPSSLRAMDTGKLSTCGSFHKSSASKPYHFTSVKGNGRHMQQSLSQSPSQLQSLARATSAPSLPEMPCSGRLRLTSSEAGCSSPSVSLCGLGARADTSLLRQKQRHPVSGSCPAPISRDDSRRNNRLASKGGSGELAAVMGLLAERRGDARYTNPFIARFWDRKPNGCLFGGSTLAAPKVQYATAG